MFYDKKKPLAHKGRPDVWTRDDWPRTTVWTRGKVGKRMTPKKTPLTRRLRASKLITDVKTGLLLHYYYCWYCVSYFFNLRTWIFQKKKTENRVRCVPMSVCCTHFGISFRFSKLLPIPDCVANGPRVYRVCPEAIPSDQGRREDFRRPGVNVLTCPLTGPVPGLMTTLARIPTSVVFIPENP